MGQTTLEAVRAACLWLPEAEEYLSHGSPNFRVRGKGFASYVVNHHGDGRVALWLAAAAGAQEHYVAIDPNQFFVPPYVGPRGWLGVRLDRGVAWKLVAALVREAYEKVAPRPLVTQIGKTPAIAAPARKPAAADIDPLQSPRGRAVLKLMRTICLPLPETEETLMFGSPVWRAGKKTYAGVRGSAQRLTLNFWVGVERQTLLTADARYHIPQFLGRNGWIALDVTAACDVPEVTALALASYRHFALKRMLGSMAIR
jgi:predicted DNA-binding protein (MmcQ/YjbR family)